MNVPLIPFTITKYFKGLHHKDIVVLEQFCVEVITLKPIHKILLKTYAKDIHNYITIIVLVLFAGIGIKT